MKSPLPPAPARASRVSRPLVLPLLLLAPLLGISAHCAPDTAPAGLRATPAGDGPEVVFDLERRPLPEIPNPNDVATFADPTSRTGRRINVSLVAPTTMESKGRQGFGELEGWGTFAPISVAFTRGLTADAHMPAIDLNDVKARMQGDGYDFSNDPVYVINLTTGVPVVLDMGNGNFPTPMRDLDVYWPNDPKAHEQTLRFETVEEGAGLTQADYSPALDLDFDGVLDHPNTLGPVGAGKVDGVDNLLTWYEKESDTLILRPVVPMEEKTEYAVILTDRLKGPEGKAVRSPFPFIHHPEQKDSVAKVQAILGAKERANYYGDLAGTGLDHVAFAWTFTTQPVYEDMRLLRDGLYGRGPFAHLAGEYPTTVTANLAIGMARDAADEPDSAKSDSRCTPRLGHPYIVKVADAKDAIHQILPRIFSLGAAAQAALELSFDAVDYFVIGSFQSPYLLGDPQHEDPDSWFHVNFKTGEGRVVADTIPFWIAIPKPTAAAKQPFPTTVWAHGSWLHADEILVRAGYFAKQGIAMMAIDMPGHGLVLDAGTQSIAEVFLRETCMVEFLSAIVSGRAKDLNGDGIADSGGYLWTSHIFHSRDNIRQSVLDELQEVRILRTFDGTTKSGQDYNNDGIPDLAGDFDGDGTPDLGGTQRIFSSGDSYGGVIAQIHGAVDPFVTAAGSISGAGGLTDIASRSSLTPTPVLQQIFSPLLIAVPASERGPGQSAAGTRCTADQRSLRFAVNDLRNSAEIEIACLRKDELPDPATVVLTNLRNHEQRCARTTPGGHLRIPIPANVGDLLDVQVYNVADAVDSYKTCGARADAPVGRHVATWEQQAVQYTQVADDATSCTADGGCAQFRTVFYPVGSPLVAPQEGLGYARQTPDARRLFDLTQAALDTADPINFAPYYMLRPLPGLDGQNLGPRPILASGTVGDPLVNIAGNNAFGRAVGALPFFGPQALQTFPEYADYATPEALYDAWGGTPNQLLIDHYVLEGIARLKRVHAGSSCSVNFATPPTAACGAAPAKDQSICDQTLYDADHHSEGTDDYDAPHPNLPLRLARIETIRATDGDTLNRSWAPRLNVLAPASPDYVGWNAPTAGLVNAYVNPVGQHVWTTSNPCKAFDDAIYFDTMLVRFFASSGQDVYFLSHPQSHLCMARQDCPFE